MKVFKGLVLLMCMLVLLTGCGSGAAQETTSKDQKMKVALLLSGPANDQGWNATALEGLKAAETKFGLETTYSENVGVADTESAYNDYAARGYDLIIGHGFQFGDPAVRVAQKFPKLHFMATEANSQAENMASYVMSCEQGGYLMGILSASMSKTGKIGVIGGIEQPSIIKELEAFKLGAKKVNPNIVVYEIYVNSFTDVSAGKDAALSMIDKGADVLYHVANQAGTGAIKAAEEKGILACGNSYDQNSIAPNTVMCSTVYNMPTVILTAVDAVKNGTFKGGITHLGMKEKVVDISPYHSFESKIPEATKKLIEATKKQITEGTLTVPVIEKSTK
ncbi:BMP family protein [Desulfosporosinus meridiei]|uniref:Putative ABC-type transport system, periplasmic component/surface lipoprotein n=1 Tax=Desulfosporosinus meridiei (strain ATCC BAA-275 / DSM 13257 / KCTC 12902 / NCIMB 13706 / S10) TaxID=768704 RepID=J7IRC1_DESMD|nr:BMP family protein [Desulfosporosinus meridiei]AFQ44200.1 putative ABC-type transport system, periplasmic component/surface lipoprotein [Desulfosporosinus meridiei DSM 13257]